ncbi:hypothetical protein V2J09_008945 [Rumex salicifolius]
MRPPLPAAPGARHQPPLLGLYLPAALLAPEDDDASRTASVAPEYEHKSHTTPGRHLRPAHLSHLAVKLAVWCETVRQEQLFGAVFPFQFLKYFLSSSDFHSLDGNCSAIRLPLITFKEWRIKRPMEINNHPYVPQDLHLPDYVPISLSRSTIVAAYLSVSLATATLVWILAGRLTKISKSDRLLMCWWVFTGLTHMVLEGYFVFSPDFFKDQTENFLAEVWKEYSKGDSRYVGRDAGVVAVEGITAVLVGPASLLAMYAIGAKKSYSYVLQLIISIGQLYGTAVYFVTAILEGDNFAVNSHYYYTYYVLANASWVVIPTLISIRCWKRICASITHQNKNKVKAR